MSKTYSEKLKDPRWQKLRLTVFKRDNFQCQDCGDDTKTLHVHHKHYEFGKDPWDYPLKSLETRCWKCHEERHNLKKYLYSCVDKLLDSEEGPFNGDHNELQWYFMWVFNGNLHALYAIHDTLSRDLKRNGVTSE